MIKRRQTELKRKPPKWEKERRRRNVIQTIIVIVIVVAITLVGYGYYATRVKPWHQPIVRVNDRVFDMDYFVKMLRLYGAGQDITQDMQLAEALVSYIESNELFRQGAERFDIYANATEIEEKYKSYFGFDPEQISEADFNARVDEWLQEYKLSRAEFTEIFIEQVILQQKMQEYLGNEEYPQDGVFDHVRIQAVLLGTQDEALDVKSQWEAGTSFDDLVNASSPSRYYPDESLEWLPSGIESAVFDEFAFAEGSEGMGLSDPIRDTEYYTTGGYWLLSVTEDSGEGEERELHVLGILLDSSSTANELKDEIAAGGEFADLAQEHSLHSSSKEAGGDMGWLTLDEVKSRFGEDNFDYVVGLGLNDVSDPILGENSKQSGYWLIEVLEREDRALSDEHRASLEQQVYEDWLDQETTSGENLLEDYLDGDKILWALDHL